MQKHFIFLYEQICKPGSVFDGYLSRRVSYLRAQALKGNTPSKLNVPKVASDRVYTPPQLPAGAVGSYPTFPQSPEN